MARLQPVKEIDAMIAANSRTPVLVLGDLRGQVGAARLGERRIRELMERYGKATILESTELLSAHTENRVRRAIATWPDGESEGESFVDHDGIDLTKPIRIHVKVKKTGDRLHFDFSGSSDQTQGPANIRPPLVRAACAYCLVALVDRFLPINHGLARCVDATFREGSVVDPRFPAAVNTYMPTALSAAEAILRALAHFVPDKRIAGGSGSAALVLGGRDAQSNRAYVHYEIFSGGTGARAGKDGVSATAFHLSNCKTAPIEIIESEFPTRIERFEMLADSGGAGEWRGGLGFVREYRILADDVRFSMRTDKHAVEPFGSSARPARRQRRLPGQSCNHTRKGAAIPLRRPSVRAQRYHPCRTPRRRRPGKAVQSTHGKSARRPAPGLCLRRPRPVRLRRRGSDQSMASPLSTREKLSIYEENLDNSIAKIRYLCYIFMK